MTINIRRMQLKDIDAVCVMEEEAFSMPWHKESFIEMMNERNALYLVAESEPDKNDDGTESDNTNAETGVIEGENDDHVIICGCAGFIGVAGEGNICNIVIRQDFRRLGIGERLVQSMIEEGKKQFGIEAFTLEVRKSNEAAIGLYEKLGFVCEGVRPGFYVKPKEDAYIYWLRMNDDE